MSAIPNDTLILALLDGALETPLWGTFLDGLRARTRADHAILNFRPHARRLDEALDLVSPPATTYAGSSPALNALFDPDKPLPRHLPPEGLPYSLNDLLRGSPEEQAEFRERLSATADINEIRQVRVRAFADVDVWLSIVRREGHFTPDDDGLLTSLVPFLRSSARSFVALERERFAASVATDAMRRMQFGWFTLDSKGIVLRCDGMASAILRRQGPLYRNTQGRLIASQASVQQEIYDCLAQAVSNPAARARAICVSRDPWIDMLLLPGRKWLIGDPKATAMVYVHRDEADASNRCEQLAELFGLAPREARMALSLSRGLTIAQAAEQQGITVGSGRMYTKAIYAKTGARCLPDLVRIILRSILAMSV